MYKCEREDEIMALLNENEYATVEYLSKKMNISKSKANIPTKMRA